MRIKFIIAFIFLSLLGMQAKAQVPGYLGSRMSVGYNLEQSVNPLAYSVTNSGDDNRRGFNRFHNLSIDYAVKKRTSLGLNLGYGAMKFSSSSTALWYDNQVNYWDVEVPYGDCKIKDLSVGIYLKKFRSGFSAPAGSYWQYALNYHMISSDDFMTHFKFALAGIQESAIVTKTSLVNFVIKKGITTPINDLIAIDYGFYAGLSLTSGAYGYLDGISSYFYASEGLFESEAFPSMAKHVVAMNTTVGISIGVRLIK